MRQLLSLLAFVTLLTGAFAGCLGEDDDPDAEAREAERLAAEKAALEAAEQPVDDGSQEANASLGEQDHIHDYWMGAERVTLMDEDIAMDPFRTLAFTFMNTAMGTPGVGGHFFELPEGSIVYEGTGQLELLVTWSDPTITGMGASYRSAESETFSAEVPLASGEPLVVEVTPGMCDMPHAKSSRWMFWLSPAQAGQSMAGTFHVKVDVVKTRDPTLFPGHPDLFGDANTLTLFDGSGQSAQTSFVQDFVSIATQERTDDSIISEKVVPMDTLSMTANLTITSAQAGVGNVADVWVEYRPADSFRYYRAQLLASDEAAGTYQFGWPVEMAQTDSPYAKQSQWHFRVRATSDPTGQGDMQLRGISDVQIDYDMVVVAYDALLEGIDPVQGDDRRGDGARS
jgi:hypothetical protein